SGNVLEAEPARHPHAFLPLCTEPGRVAETYVKLVELAREVLVVQVKPVVLLKSAGNHFLVPYGLVLYTCISERERDRIIPRRGFRRRVDGYPGRLLQRYRLHVARGNLTPDGSDVPAVHRLEHHSV